MVENSHYVVVLLGPPLGGKGTQATKLARRGYFHLDVGDILRREIDKRWSVLKDVFSKDVISENTSKDSDRVREAISFLDKTNIMAKGKNLPDDFICDLVHEELPVKLPEKIVFTGFPRSKRQANWLLYNVVRPNQCLLDVVKLEVPTEIIALRLQKRSKEQGRADDTRDVLDERMTEFDNYSKSVVDILSNHTRSHRGYTQINGAENPDLIAIHINHFIESARDRTGTSFHHPKRIYQTIP